MTCVGTGLIALDVLFADQFQVMPKFYAGGSCGNVLTILSKLGWKSIPIGKVKDDKASEILISDLERFQVSTKFIQQAKNGSTPIVIHKILKKNGRSRHKFYFKDPKTKVDLPVYIPIGVNSFRSKFNSLPKANVYYFDRANNMSLKLATHYKKEGALVVFEPASMGDRELFEQAANTCHILKFSKQQMSNYPALYPVPNAPLEIETLGGKGLRYRYSLNKVVKRWKRLPAFNLDHKYLVDPGGAGDWSTAGIIYKLGEHSISPFVQIDELDIIKALNYGQALSLINCCFAGARGAMYLISDKQIKRLANQITIGKVSDDIFLKLKKLNSESNLLNSADGAFNISSLYN